MPSQFFGLNIAGSGLRNANAALNTTANNAANTQTKGYSRQQVESTAADALRTYTTYGCAGAGVETLAIERIRDNFFDVKYWNNNANVGQFEAKAYYMRTLEDYFDDDGATGFVTVFNKMEDALQSITTNVSSTSTKAQFIASAEGLTDYFNGLYGNLQQLQNDINLEIKQCLDQINSISSQIASLNKQINVIELSGTKANDLRDKRDVLIDELSTYIDVTTQETPIMDTNDPTRETGGTRFVVKVAGGQILVDANDFEKLDVVARTHEEKINDSDIDGLYKVYWENGNEFNLNNASLNGKLKGLVELRDGNNGEYFSGTVDAATTTDTLAVRLDPTKANYEYLSDPDKITLPYVGTISINNIDYEYDSWTYDPTAETYTFTMKSGNDIPTTAVGGEVHIGAAYDYKGIPYYMSQMNAFVRSFFREMNHRFEDGSDAYGNAGTNLFTAQMPNGKLTQAEIENETIVGNIINSVYPNYCYMNAGNACINEELLRDADRLGYRSSEPDLDASGNQKVDPYTGRLLYTGKPLNGVEECEVVKGVIQMLSDRDQYSFRNAPANQMLEMILSDVALNSSNAQTHEKTYKGLQTTIDNQRTSISGVDEDEEAVNLVKYQNAYTLASKMIQTLTEVYDQLILRTGV
ncbi:MAG: flagellar hook-associated protein FlgK [Lachnospiraceae bacterium]|nr:flagellar hook-associated protein FlgK [Lachnospiraceae bacterium]